MGGQPTFFEKPTMIKSARIILGGLAFGAILGGSLFYSFVEFRSSKSKIFRAREPVLKSTAEEPRKSSSTNLISERASRPSSQRRDFTSVETSDLNCAALKLESPSGDVERAKSLMFKGRPLLVLPAQERENLDLALFISIAATQALTPEVSDYEVIGLRYHSKPDPSLQVLEKAGLRNGDVVTALNGVQIRSLDDVAKVARELRSSEWLNVNVIRAEGHAEEFQVTLNH